ncbi:uncharacterized protein LOC109820128 isoform X2 [Asparagus officinalis]|uniref:uncharacterized protein LOC109820128 isoform X2 n=1 Tax=Asparagus officinalis TaxID=4686 RepID=UPI00098E3615|nr:uncharacterized protein LOC109820128 isoform X2 [Asparagus officinalis]
MDRDLEDLRSLKELEKNIWKDNYERLLKRNVKLEIEMEKMNSSLQGLKENYERLLKRNTKLETYMAGMNSSFQGLKDEMLLLKEEKSREAEEEIAMNVGITEDAKVRRPYLQLPCRSRVLVNCPNGSQKSLGHLSQLPSPIESDQQPCVTNPQCTRQRVM